MERYISLEAKKTAAGIKLDDRIEYMAKAPAYITLKDHQDNFRLAHPFNKPMQKRNWKDQQTSLRKYKQKSGKTSSSKPVEKFGKCH